MFKFIDDYKKKRERRRKAEIRREAKKLKTAQKEMKVRQKQALKAISEVCNTPLGYFKCLKCKKVFHVEYMEIRPYFYSGVTSPYDKGPPRINPGSIGFAWKCLKCKAKEN